MRRIYITISAALIAGMTMAADLVVAPGTLAETLTDTNLSESPSLVLSGRIDARDLAQMRHLPSEVTVLDLSGVAIDSWKSNSEKLFDRTYLEGNLIPSYCFFRAPLSEVILPMNLSKIEAGAFAGSALSRIVIPEGVTEIGDYAFYDCNALKEVVLPSSLKKIGKGAFGNCTALTAIDMSETAIAEIPEACFAGCTAMKVANVASATKIIDKEAFRGTSVYELNLEDVAQLRAYALSGMSQLKTLTLNPSATLGEGVLMDDNQLLNVTGAPENLPPLFAANCDNLNASVHTEAATTIGDYAFANSAVNTLVFSGGLTKIGDGAFHSMPNLNYITADALKGNIPEVTEHSFDGLNRPDIKLYVDDDYYQDWASTPEWNQFNIITATVTKLENVATDTAISIFADANVLTVQAPEVIKGVDIFSLDGRLLLSNAGGASDISISLKDIQDNVIVVNAATENMSRSVKLMK